jgi:hypothetical protein
MPEKEKGGKERMTTIGIEDVHDITIDVSRTEVKIDVRARNGGYTRFEMSMDDAELLYERLGEALRKI